MGIFFFDKPQWFPLQSSVRNCHIITLSLYDLISFASLSQHENNGGNETTIKPLLDLNKRNSFKKFVCSLIENIVNH